jgi:hypothetical protein
LIAFSATLVPPVFSSSNGLRINADEVLFGIEYTFQDKKMTQEIGRSKGWTPHKEKKIKEMLHAYLQEFQLSEKDFLEIKTLNSLAFEILTAEEKYHINIEPVTIEVKSQPKKRDEILFAADPIFKIAKAIGLVPYVNPAAERSGMGHVHVGGRPLQKSPFYQNPHLLRNMMVYFHKHPSLLFGLAEAYDIGLGSNIESFHEPDRQRAFQRVIQKFDRWYEKPKDKEMEKKGLIYFMNLLTQSSHAEDFLSHYRTINLENLKGLPSYFHLPRGVSEGLIGHGARSLLTVEFRSFRPPLSSEHAQAYADYLLALMERLSEPGYLDPFEWISPEHYDRFYTASKIQSDWEHVKNELSVDLPLIDLMIEETVRTLHSQKTKLFHLPQAELFPAYSPKELKGQYFELRLPVSQKDSNAETKKIKIGKKSVHFEKVSLAGASYWIALLDLGKLDLDLTQIIHLRDLKTEPSWLNSLCERFLNERI